MYAEEESDSDFNITAAVFISVMSLCRFCGKQCVKTT